MSERKSKSDVLRERAAFQDLIPGLAALLLAQGSLEFANPDASSSAWNLAWSMTPLIGIGLLAWAQIRVLRRADERERLQQLAAMAVGFGVLSVLLAAVGVLQGADLGDPLQQTQITFLAGVLAWVGALTIIVRRAS